MRRALGIVLLAAALAVAPGCGGSAESGTGDATAGNQAFERREFDAAFENLLPFAERGEADAQFKIGFMYYHGRGVERDIDEGMRWLRLAADQGDAEGQYNLALGYARPGPSQDLVEADVWATLAAGQGYRAAEELKQDVAGQMTEDQTREARKRVSEWRVSQ